MFDELPTGLRNFRIRLGIGAADMAPLMGLPLLEANPDLLTPLYVKAALFAAIVVAAHHRGYSAPPHELSDLLRRLHEDEDTKRDQITATAYVAVAQGGRRSTGDCFREIMTKSSQSANHPILVVG